MLVLTCTYNEGMKLEILKQMLSSKENFLKKRKMKELKLF